MNFNKEHRDLWKKKYSLVTHLVNQNMSLQIQGGSNDYNNFQLLYSHCNKKKGNKHPESVKIA